MKDLLIFDMDGVLVDVSESYRAAIQATVLHFTGTEPTNDEVQVWKNRGGFNDDWKLSHRMIQELGEEVAYEDVVARFQQIFLGEANDGLILRERWLAKDGLFDRLAAKSHSGNLHWPLWLGSAAHTRSFRQRNFRPRRRCGSRLESQAASGRSSQNP